MVNLEICIDNIDSINILCSKEYSEKIKRIEICSALAVDGLSPSISVVHFAKNLKNVEKHVMIRPRPGDFFYTEQDLELMLYEIKSLQER